MKIEECVKGNYYFGRANTGDEYIFKSDGGRNCGDYIWLKNKSFQSLADSRHRSSNWIDYASTNWVLRSLTTIERIWLDKCIEANHFLPLEAITNVCSHRLKLLKLYR